MIHRSQFRSFNTALIATLCVASAPASADVVTEWNAMAAETVAAAKTRHARRQPDDGDRPDGRVRSHPGSGEVRHPRPRWRPSIAPH